MKRYEINIFLIENINELSCYYYIYRVKGLSYNSEEFHKNKQQLINSLRKKTHSPLIPFIHNNILYIAQLDGFEDLPKNENLIRTSVSIEKIKKRMLDFGRLNKKTLPLATKFLRWELQSTFYNNINLWQPKSGHPFFHKLPDNNIRKISQKIDLFKGFSFRIVKIREKIGICIDLNRKFVSQSYLPYYITKEEFERNYFDRNCLYEYGTDWYEIKLKGRNELKPNQVNIPEFNCTLYEHIISRNKKFNIEVLKSLPEDFTILYYFKDGIYQRNVPSGLCRLTYKTNHPDIKGFHSFTLLKPKARRKEIIKVVNKYFNHINFGKTRLKISNSPLIIREKRFNIPNLIFGCGKVLTLKDNNKDFIKVRPSLFGSFKQKLLLNSDVGLYTNKKFDYQYFILPISISDTYGTQFIKDLKSGVQNLYFNGEKIYYNPKIVYYNDKIQKNFYRIGKEIINVIKEKCKFPGYGIVMIPEIKYSSFNKEDELANYVMSEARRKNIFVSIIHNKIPYESYSKINKNGNNIWNLSPNINIQKRFKGYLRNVILNKILILNHFWPFVLKDNLDADLIIGIDVKNNFAGFTFINKNADLIFFRESKSNNKEMLSMNQVYSEIYKSIKSEPFLEGLTNIVIHRHGKIFPSEKKGIEKAFALLEKEGIFTPNYKYTIVEIRTTSRIPFRQFEVRKNVNKMDNDIYNPKIGTYTLFSSDEAFLCTTGFPYKISGTSKPIHIFKEGYNTIKSVLKDVFYLSNLTFTRLDYCSRLPFSIKLNDIRLKEFAGDYNQDDFKYGGGS